MTLHRFGLGNLSPEDRPQEALGKEMVRVSLKAVALNHRDVLVMRGSYGPGLVLPLIPCSDGAGVIVEVGANVRDLRTGDRVCTHMVPDWQDGPLKPQMWLATLGGPEQGVLSEERALPRGAVVPIPAQLAFEHAACLPVAGLAAWRALTEGHTGHGSCVLLIGAGGVSMMGLGIAKALGARVAVISSSDQKLTRARAMGAELTVNNRREPWAERVREWSEGGVDVVLETGGESTLNTSIKATREGGFLALLGAPAPRPPAVNLTEVLVRQIRIHGIFVGSRAELDRYVAFVAQHRIAPVIDHVFDGLAAARHAFAHLVSGRHLGKVVIGISI